MSNSHSNSNHHHHHDDSKDAVHRGIRNSGNSCYFNAILQALAGLPTFICDLKDNRVKEAFLKDESCYKTFLQITNQCAERSQVPIDARKAQNAVSKHCKQFANKKQQDAHELLSTFLTILELEIFPFLKEKKERYLSKSIKLHEIPIADRPGLFCPTKRNFSFLIKKQFCCTKCGDKPEVVEIFRDLSLEIFDNEDIDGWDRENLSEEVNDWIETISTPPSVQDMLRFYFLPEKIERLCKCGCNVTIIKKSIASLPRILTLHIKRFIHSDSGMKKLECKIKVDNELELGTKVITNPLQDTISFDINQLPRNKCNSESEGDDEESKTPDMTEDEHITKVQQWMGHNNMEIEEKQHHQKIHQKRTYEEMELDLFLKVSHMSSPKGTKAEKKKFEESTDSESEESTNTSDEDLDSKDVNALQEEIEELMLNSENSNSSEDLNLKYRLKCIVHHLGAKVTSGHYTAEILDHWKDVWYRYNDSKVTKSVPETKACESAYILFYVHDSCWPILDYSSG
jgi:ubiquitin C-terminal hydrolase